jgi:hypothetical protein
VNRCSRCLKWPDQPEVAVFFRMEFKSKIGLLTLFCPGTFFVSPGFCIVSPGSIGRCMSRICRDECRILDHTFPNLQYLSFQLSL